MSALRAPNGDDHPDAAQKHLEDAKMLLAQNRFDGAAYLSGYVVECSLKSLVHFETGRPESGHNLRNLAQIATMLATVAGAKTARYVKSATGGIAHSPIMAWRPEMRYRSPTMSSADAQTWCNAADAVFRETVAQMRLDGVL